MVPNSLFMFKSNCDFLLIWIKLPMGSSAINGWFFMIARAGNSLLLAHESSVGLC
jgi:hypothetical protein